MDAAFPQSPVFGRDLVSDLHFSRRRAWRVVALTCSGAEFKSARMRLCWDGFVSTRETFPE
jgi:hypothetical protein